MHRVLDRRSSSSSSSSCCSAWITAICTPAASPSAWSTAFRSCSVPAPGAATRAETAVVRLARRARLVPALVSLRVASAPVADWTREAYVERVEAAKRRMRETADLLGVARVA